MKIFSKSSNTQLFVIGLLFLILYFLFYPTNILIFDELLYLQQGSAYAQGSPLLHDLSPISQISQSREPGHYPIGTPFFLATLIFFFGKKAVFLQGIISLLGAYFFSIKTLKNLELDQRFALLLFLFFPTTLLCRTLMSDIPSLLIVSWSLYLFTADRNKVVYILSAGFLMGLSFLFRETNILLFVPFLLGIFFRENARFGIYGVFGFIIALGIRGIGSYWAFGDPFFMKDPGVTFSIKFFLKNIIFYLPFLFVFIPLGGWAVFKYKDKFHLEIKIALILFISLYLLYGYNGTNFSGMKSLILGPRFLIPTLPLFAICLAKMCESYFKGIKKILIPLSLMSIFFTQFIGYYYNLAQQKAFQGLEKNPHKIHFIADINTVPKIFHPSSDDNNFLYLRDSLMIDDVINKDTFMYVETAFRGDNKIAKQYTNNFNEELDKLFIKYKREELFQYTLPDNITIKQYKISHFTK